MAAHDYLAKIVKLRRHEYVCLVPPVCTGLWTDDSWIKWIDSHGKWL